MSTLTEEVSTEGENRNSVSNEQSTTETKESINIDEDKSNEKEDIQEEEEDENDTPFSCCCFKSDPNVDEQTRLGAQPALITLLKLSFGPFCSQVVTALYTIVDSFYISHTIGADGLTATGVVSLLENINNSFGLFLSACAASRISYLFGQKRKKECAQLFVDLIRVSWIISIILPIIMLNIVKPITKWFGADDHIQEMGFQYMIPMSGLTVFFEMYQVCCGLLQSEGLSWLYAVCQVTSLILNMGCLDPLFLMGIKTPIWGASFASILSSLLPMIFLMVLLFRGKMTVKPKFRMFLNKFSPETKSALKMGLSTLVELLSVNLPDVFLQKYVGNAANNIGKYNEVLSAWNIMYKIYNLIVCVNAAIAQGLLPAASFAFGAGRFKRLRNLSLHALWVGTAWNALCELVILLTAKSIAKIWVSDPEIIDITDKFLNNAMYTSFLIMVRYFSITTLQACKKIMISTVQSILTTLIPLPVFSTILYFTDKNNPTRITYSFMMLDVFTFLVCGIVALVALNFLYCPKKLKEIEKKNGIELEEQYSDNSANDKTSQEEENENEKDVEV